MLDVFKADAFSTASLTTSINKAPYKPGRLGAMGLFKPKPITTTTAQVEELEGKIALLSTSPRGVVPQVNTRSNRKLRSLIVPHISAQDDVWADEVSGIRAFGSETELETVADLVNTRLETFRQNAEITHEYHRIGALLGNVLDADGSTVLYNLFDEFDITENEIEFNWNANGFDAKLVSLSVIRAIEDALGATPYQYIHAFCGDTFFDELISNPSVRDIFKAYQDAGKFGLTQQRSGFEFGGIVWENYRGKVGSVDFIPTDKARFVPVGVPDLFQVILSPANFIETVNTPGKAIYAKQKAKEWDMGIDILIQSNPLHLCTRPGTLVTGIPAGG